MGSTARRLIQIARPPAARPRVQQCVLPTSQKAPSSAAPTLPAVQARTPASRAAQTASLRLAAGGEAAARGRVEGRAAPGSNAVSAADLRAIMPDASEASIQRYVGPLNQAMREFGITTPKRQQAFLAQVAHESGQLRYNEEIASGAAYEGRRDLGNTRSGDGRRYKGRGLIQLTGRSNYRTAGRALGVDLEGNPAKASSDPLLSARIAGWFWESRGLNTLADDRRFLDITKRINGGTNGLDDRRARYRAAQNVIT